LLEDYPDRLDANGRDFLNRIRAASQRMGLLIDDLLKLARVTRDEMRRGPVDLSALAGSVAEGLRQAYPGQRMEFTIAPGLFAQGDARLLQLALQNLLENAVKFSSKHPVARIEFGRTERKGAPVFFVRDHGAGFDPTAAVKLFGAFQRFHTAAEFPGTGIGLATVQRIIHRHDGHIEAESRPGHGATFYFTLPGRDQATQTRPGSTPTKSP
jgi:signal transduction histidine kinase